MCVCVRASVCVYHYYLLTNNKKKASKATQESVNKASFFFLDWSIPISFGISCSNLLLSLSHRQGQKVATCLFITSPRSSEMQSSCKCSCLLATSSLPKSLWTERLIRANVLVSKMDCGVVGGIQNKKNTHS